MKALKNLGLMVTLLFLSQACFEPSQTKSSLWLAHGQIYQWEEGDRSYKAIYITDISFDEGRNFLKVADRGLTQKSHPKPDMESQITQNKLLDYAKEVDPKMVMPRSWLGTNRIKARLGPHVTITSAKETDSGIYTFKIDPSKTSRGRRGNLRFKAIFSDKDNVIRLGESLNVTVGEL